MERAVGKASQQLEFPVNLKRFETMGRRKRKEKFSTKDQVSSQKESFDECHELNARRNERKTKPKVTETFSVSLISLLRRSLMKLQRSLHPEKTLSSLLIMKGDKT